MKKTAPVLLWLGWVAMATAGDGRYEIAQYMLPLTITNPGSYVVTENLTGAAAASGIVIGTDDVAIDLNGFQVVGAPSSLDGIGVSGNRMNLAVRNGVVRNWGDDGVDLRSASNSTVRDLRVFANTDDGIRVGDGALVQDCQVLENGGDGIETGEASAIRDCVARDNSGAGILGTSACVIANCVARDNSGTGIQGGLGSSILGSVSRSNNRGILAARGSHVSDSVGYGNNFGGVTVHGPGGVISGCTAYGNNDYGIDAGEGVFVTQCAASGNEIAGIRATTNTYLLSNVCYENGTNTAGAGVLVQGRGNRLDRNHAGNSPYGYRIVGDSNIVTRNTAALTSTASLLATGAGNAVGPVTNNPASAGPWDNFGL
jgi:hypothetical protein